MSTARHTAALAGVLAALVAADVAVRVGGVGGPELAALPGFELSEVTSLTVTSVLGPVQLAATPEWTVEVPEALRGPAEAEAVEAALRPLARGLVLDARVDEGDHERYGLTGGEEVRVDVQGARGSLAALYVGDDAPGGSTFVRLPGEDDVYRARIGGRARWDRPGLGWRDARVFGVVADEVQRIRITRDEPELDLRRDGEGWTAGFDLDPATVHAVLGAFERLRAVELLSPDHPTGLDTPDAVVVLEGTAGVVRVALARSGPHIEARREGHAEQFRIRGELLDLLVAPVDRWRDRRVWSLPADDIRGLVLEEPGLTSRLERDAAGSWTLVEPANVDADPARARAAAQALAELRVERWVAVEPVEAGFPGALWIRVDAGGPLRTLQVGSRVGTEGAQYYVRTADQPERIGVIDGRVLVGLRGAWGR